MKLLYIPDLQLLVTSLVPGSYLSTAIGCITVVLSSFRCMQGYSSHFLPNPFDTTCYELLTVSGNEPPSVIVFVGGVYDRSAKTCRLF